jgi:hypothetical protein
MNNVHVSLCGGDLALYTDNGDDAVITFREIVAQTALAQSK